MPNCPVCQSEGSAFGSEYKCPNNHVWHICSEHNTEVVSSLIGESHVLPEGCSCGMNCLSPKEMQKNPVVYKEQEEKISIVPNTTHFNDKILANVEAINKKIRQEMAKQNVLFAAPIRRPKRLRNKITQKIEKEIKLPNAENMPLGIHPNSKELWPQFIIDHEKDWKKYDDPKRQWGTAIAIWRNYASKRGYHPFAEGQTDKLTSDYMLKRVKGGLEKAFAVTKTMTKYFLSKNFCSRVLVLALKDIDKKKDNWQIVLGQELKKCISFDNEKFQNFLATHSFKPARKCYMRNVVANVDVILRQEKEGSFMYIRFLLPEPLVKMAIGLTEQELSNKDKVKKALTKFIKSSLKEVRTK